MTTAAAATKRKKQPTPRPSETGPAVRIAVGAKDGAADVSLRLSCTGPWAAILGAYELPDDSALDTLAAAAEKWITPPARIDLIAAPASCLLPVLWLRTIWLGPEAPIHLDWLPLKPPGADAREQLAARLCCALVNSVRCADAASAERWWGITPGEVSPPGADVFDLALGLIDCWDIRSRSGPIADPAEWHMRARTAFEDCNERGLRRIAIYGAGTHTRALGAVFMAPPVEIVCIIDDDATRHGERMWGFPIVSRAKAVELGVDAVVLSANVHEPRLVEGAGAFAGAGIEVIRLYPDVAFTDNEPVT